MAHRCNTPKGTLTEHVNHKWRNGLKIPYSHTSRSSFNIKQDKCLAETFGQCGRKRILTFSGVQDDLTFCSSETYLLPSSKSSCNHLVKQVLCEFRGNVSKKKPKTFILTYLGPIWGKNMAHKGYFSLKPERTHNMPVNQVSWSHNKNFLRKLTKT